MSNVKQALANKPQQQQTKIKTIQQHIKAMEPQIAKALPSVMTPERFTRIALTALSSTPKLQQCDSNSFLGAMMQAAQLGLEPNTPLGQAYLIPYENKRRGVVECQFQLGYKGLIDLAYRSGEFKNISAHTVYENDIFEFEYGLEHKLIHKPALINRGNAIAYYATFSLVNGGSSFVVMSREDVETFAKSKSVSFFKGPWQTDFDAMAKKTVLKKLLKYAPIKTEFARGIATDESIKTKLSDDMTLEANEADYIDIESKEAVNTNELMDGMTSAEVDAMLAAEEGNQ